MKQKLKDSVAIVIALVVIGGIWWYGMALVDQEAARQQEAVISRLDVG